MIKTCAFSIIVLMCALILTYSQTFIDYGIQNQGKELHQYFHDVTDGYYVDYGAYDPIFASNTLNLYTQGWQGINVEANPERLNRFFMQRPDQTNLNYAIGEQDSFVVLFELDEDSSSTISPKVKDYVKQYKKLTKQIKIGALTMKQICDRFYMRKPNFMNLDLQGYGYRALQTNDWTNQKCIPEIIFSQINQELKQSGYPLPQTILTKNNYKKVKTLGLNEIYIHQSVYDKYTQRAAQVQQKIANLKSISPFQVVLAIGEYLKTSSQVVKHYEPQKDNIYYKFAKKNEPVELEKINSQSNLLNPQNLNRPIVIFHLDPRSNFILFESANFKIQKIEIASYKFYQLNVTLPDGKIIRSLIFDHQFEPATELKIISTSLQAKPLEGNRPYVPTQFNTTSESNKSKTSNITQKQQIQNEMLYKWISELAKGEQTLKSLSQIHHQNLISIQSTIKSNMNAQIQFLNAIQRKLNDLEQKIKSSPPQIQTKKEDERSFNILQAALQMQLTSVQTLQIATLVTALVMGILLCASICFKKQQQYNKKIERLKQAHRAYVQQQSSEA